MDWAGRAGIARWPPRLRDDRLSLEQLGRVPREFDQISRRDGRDWPAVRFVEWLRDEWRISSEANVTAGERRQPA